MASQSIDQGGKIATPTVPTRAHYTFGGWYKETGLTNTWNFSTDTVSSTTTLYAKWIIDRFTLTYAAGTNGSLIGSLTQILDHGTNGTAVTAVPGAGYKFVQWSDGSTQNPRTDLAVTASLTATATFAAIQTGVLSGNTFAWSETSGWINVAPTSASLTAKLGANGFLSGFAWSENLGWIRFAANGATGPFANNAANTWGVNVAVDGKLSGHAWSETAGWINFGATNADAAINLTTGTLTGHAWGENIGWIKFSGTGYSVRFQL